MNDDRLLELNNLGLIPGPSEAKEEFLLRVEYCLNLHSNWPDLIPSDDQIITIGEFSSHCLKKTKELFDISPKWIPLFFSNYQLMAWHGGAAWIFQKDEESPTSAFFQLRRVFQKNQKYLRIYDRSELIAHEVSHVGRMMFEEPKFEELIAYRTSNSIFRRFFGSIVQSSKESMIFVSLLFMTLSLDFYFISFRYEEAFQSALMLKLIPVGLFLYGCIRLWNRQRTFSKALDNLKAICRFKEHAEAVIYRLTDQEIGLFSKLSKKQIAAYIHENKSKSLRMHLIALAYFEIK